MPQLLEIPTTTNLPRPRKFEGVVSSPGDEENRASSEELINDFWRTIGDASLEANMLIFRYWINNPPVRETAFRSAAETVRLALESRVNSAPSIFPVSVQALSDQPRALNRLSELRQLQSDWDSYGAVPPTSAALMMAERFISSTFQSPWHSLFGLRLEPTSIGARADGGILIEWQGPRGILELHIEPDSSLGYLFEDPVTGKYTEEDSVAWTTAQQLLAEALSK
jgi:hypothetical protein